MATTTFANPTGGVVAAGSASISQTPGLTKIQQNSQKTIINWQSFNIAAKEKTHFQQPVNGAALNRISPQMGASQIYGQLSATGKVILVNQAGIYFGPGSHVDVGGMIASTSDITDAHFLAGRYIFDRPSPNAGSVINEGTIKAADYGLVALIGTSVVNNGQIQARMGNVVLASGNKFTLDLYGDQLINFSVDAPATEAGKDQNGQPLKNAVSNSGSIVADGGRVILTAKAARGVVDNAINMDGVVQANSVSQQGGTIILSGGDEGVVKVSGKVYASGKTVNARGGKIHISGRKILVEKTAKMDVSGDTGGGEVLIGGDYQGKLIAANTPNAVASVVLPGAVITADAITSGNGGRVIVWSDDTTKFYGTISARGGSHSGNGGFVETSGKNFLDVAGARIDTRAPAGQLGTWLLDPRNIIISSSSTSGGTFNNGNPDLFSPNANDAIVNVSDLVANLSLGNVKITTGSTGAQAGDITVANAISWNTGNSLTLSAFRNITLNANITNTGGASVVLQADNTGTGTGTVSGGANHVTLSGGSGTVSVYYNPVVFGTPDTIYTGGTAPTAYMLINSLGAAADTTTRSLASVSNSSAMWDKNFALATDINATLTSTWNAGAGFSPIGDSVTAYTGQFDGQNHIISGLTINRASDYLGLFGAIDGAQIRNTGLSNASITAIGVHNYTGALVGSAINNSQISNSYATGLVSGYNFVGGLVGFNISSLINQSFADVNVTGTNVYIGGLVGLSAGAGAIVSNSYAQGSVTGVQTVGGLIGENQAAVNNSYSSGAVSGTTFVGGFVGVINGGSYSANYWDTTSSGQASGSGFGSDSQIIGETTSLMMQSSTFSGWDFSTPIWGIINSFTRPYLNWKYQGVSGTAYTNSTGSTDVGAGSALALAANGAVLSGSTIAASQSITDSNGFYYFLLDKAYYSNFDPLLIYLNNAATQGNTVGLFSTTGAPNAATANVYGNTVTLQSNNGMFSNSLLATAAGSLPSGDTDILYSASGNNLTLGNATHSTAHFITQSGVGYQLDGNLSVIGGGTASMTFDGPVTLTSNSTLNAGSSNITFSSTIDGAFDLALNSTSSTTLAGIIGGSTALSSLTTNAGGSTQMGANITTSNAQTYNDAVTLTGTLSAGGAIGFGGPVTLAGNSTLNAGSNNITFSSTIDGPFDLTLNSTGATTLAGIIGGSVLLSTLTTNAGGSTQIGANITTASDQTYNDAVILTGGGAKTLSTAGTGAIGFGSTLDGASDLLLNVGGVLTLNGAVGGTSALSSLSIFAFNGMSIGSNITTTGDQFFNNDIFMIGSGAKTWTSTGSGNISLASTLDGAYDLTLNTAGVTSFNGAVGGTSALTSLTTDTAGSTNIGANITTTGTQTYNDAVALTASVGLTGSSFTFNQGISGAFAVNLNGTAGGNNTFTLRRGSNIISANSISIIGNTTGINTLLLDNGSSVAQNWVINGSNSGTATSAVTFSRIQNLTGGSGNDSFTLSGGTLSGSINGSSGTNTLVGNSNTANSWNLSGLNSGTVTGISGGFSNMQNLTGGIVNDMFNFAANATLSGLITGGNADTTTLNLAASTSPLTISLGTTSSVTNSAGTVARFANINNLTGTGSDTIQTAASKNNTVHILGTGYGYINDPLYFTGFNTVVGLGNTQVIFDISTSLNRTTGVATINGGTTQFFGISPSAYSGNISSTTVTSTESSAIFTSMQTPTTSSSPTSEPTSLFVQNIQGTPATIQSIEAISDTQNQLDIQEKENKKIGCTN